MTDFKTIPLTKGHKTIVDSTDYNWLNQWKWCALMHDRTAYAFRAKYYKEDDVWKRINRKMHRLIMQAPKGMQVDHINGDGLDNRRCNLRLATHRQNVWNQRKFLESTASKYKGVRYVKRNSKKKWIAVITCNYKKCIHLGSFSTEIEAALAYNLAAVQYFGRFAKINNIEISDAAQII